MPIIIEKNDYSVNLFNGDIGIFLPDEKQNNQLVAWFMRSDGTYRSGIPPSPSTLQTGLCNDRA